MGRIMKRLVLIHGRSQEEKEPDALKADWVQALHHALATQGRSLPDNVLICFPYYGDSLAALCKEPDQEIPEVLLRGQGTNAEERRLLEYIMRTLARRYGITDADAVAACDSNVVERGIQNTALVLGIARLLSGAQGVSTRIVQQFTHDVYSYLTNGGIAGYINDGIRKAFDSDSDTVVVSHSLGTVISLKVLSELDTQHRVSHLITLGSPLGIPLIQELLAPLKRPACLANWSNARDPKDLVALFPLIKPYFPLTEILDDSSIENMTANHHGISGYIGHPNVALMIHQALCER
jgi:hypothetical protein